MHSKSLISLFCSTIISVTILTAATGCRFGSIPEEDFGHFKEEVIAKWMDDGRSMKLLENFSYIAPDGKRWNAPRGSVVDGASIPKWAWSLIGGPFEGKYRNASVVHDVACQEKKEPWPEVHEMFYNACRCGGVGKTKAKIMYWAVYQGCPRWKKCLVDGKPVYEMRSPPIKHLDEVQVKKIASYIEKHNPSLEELRGLMLDSPKL